HPWCNRNFWVLHCRRALSRWHSAGTSHGCANVGCGDGKKSILRSQPVFCDPVLIKKKRLEQLARALIQLCFSGLLAVLCRSHVLCRKTHPFPGAILQDATPAAAEAEILSAFAARDGFPAIAAWVAVLHRAPA